MDGLTDKVIPIRETGNAKLNDFQQSIFSARDHHEMIRAADKYFLELPIENPNDTIDQIINHIIDSNGDVTINALVSKFYLAERQFQRLFRKYVGLSPKFYTRIIRFNYIFELAQNQKLALSDVVSLAGYYDQSHFIRNFKSFTGEDPSKYIFEENNLANFFLNKK
jgi:AraC-like DNA-binding protein